MPTTIPLRAIAPHSDEGLASFCGALLLFYSALTLVLLSLTAVEMHLGMYRGLTLAEAFFSTGGIDADAGQQLRSPASSSDDRGDSDGLCTPCGLPASRGQ
jgi:hypothetical protein